jgi:steroid delta-isomerase-like uncharacterized protein
VTTGDEHDGPAAVRDAVERYLGALNAHDPDATAACVAVDFFNEHTSALGTSVRGREAYRGRLNEFFGRFRELHYDIEDCIVDGDRAAVPYRMTFTVTEDGHTAPVAIRGMFRFRVAGGEIIHRTDYWDSGEFTRQTARPHETERTS